MKNDLNRQSQGSAGQVRNTNGVSGKTIARVRLNADESGNVGASGTNNVQSENPVQNHPFSQEDLIKAWKNFVSQSEDVYLRSVVSYTSPKLTDDYKVEIEVLNPEQADYFRENGTSIKEYLFSALKNNLIELDIRLKTKDHIQTLFTEKEKYLYMVDKNPCLKDLVKEFNLCLD